MGYQISHSLPAYQVEVAREPEAHGPRVALHDVDEALGAVRVVQPGAAVLHVNLRKAGADSINVVLIANQSCVLWAGAPCSAAPLLCRRRCSIVRILDGVTYTKVQHIGANSCHTHT